MRSLIDPTEGTLVTVNEAVRDLLADAKPGAVLDGLYVEAQRKGLKLSRNSIAKARRGDLIQPREETLSALSVLFGVDVRKLREAVGRQRGELGPYIPTPRAASLTQSQRRALDDLIVTIVEQGGQTDAGIAEDQKTDDDDGGGGVIQGRFPPKPDGGAGGATRRKAARKARLEQPPDSE